MGDDVGKEEVKNDVEIDSLGSWGNEGSINQNS